MNQRDILKNIVKFGKKEFSEKRPISLQVLRIKSKSVLKRGMLPNLNIKQIHGIFFLVVLDYKEYFRIYFFNRNGELAGGENLRKTANLMKKLSKETNLEYKLPKSRPTLTINNITSHYREKFNMHLQRMNQTFVMNIKRPIIIAREDLKLIMDRKIGCERDIKKNIIYISKEAYKKDIFELIITREIMFLFLGDLFMMLHNIEENEILMNDLALLFSNFYLRNEKNAYICNVIKNSAKSFLKFDNGNDFIISDKIIEILNKNGDIYTAKEVHILFINIFNCLKILKKYGIRLDNREFLNLFFALCDIFSRKDNEFHLPISKSNYIIFYQDVFKKSLIINPNSKKDQYLVYMFDLLSMSGEKITKFDDILNQIKNLTEDIIVKEDILRNQKLINDALVEYLFEKVILISTEHVIKNNLLELIINIENQQNLILQDFSYSLSWKPKNRFMQDLIEDLIKSRDLHSGLKRKYCFSIKNKGNISFILRIEFKSPLNNEVKIRKLIKLDKIKL